MALALERLIKDVKVEPSLWSSFHQNKSTEAVEAAWQKIGSKNNLTSTEARSIFKVLYKKFRQESLKPKSSWQLLEHLRFLDEDKIQNKKESIDITPPSSEPPAPIEEDTYIEFLEVKEEEYSDEETPPSKDNSLENSKSRDVLNKGECSSTTQEGKNVNNKRKLSETSENNVVLSAKRPIKVETEVEKINGITTVQASVQTENHQITADYTNFSSFGVYIANTLNKLPKKLASKLEIQILQAIIHVNSEIADQ